MKNPKRLIVESNQFNLDLIIPDHRVLKFIERLHYTVFGFHPKGRLRRTYAWWLNHSQLFLKIKVENCIINKQ